MTTSEQPPAQGLIAGKYQLVKMIGRGGMGSVWEARHVSLGTSSAIKFIEAEYADSQEARSRFDKEAKAAATIQSKHAIQIFDHGVTEDGKPYIVMELLQGEPLDKRIERFGRLSLIDTARILQQVCRGLARAHERGIIHRDLKPENIFLVRNVDDDEEVAKVLDFGIAKMSSTGAPTGVTSSTKTGAVLGTPFYMSPEQARGLRNVDHRTDVWSLGVIAYKCMTGVLPFDGESVGDLLVKICTAPIPLPSQTVPGLPPNFDAWFLRAMEREPDRRFSTVTELSDALAFAAGLPVRGGVGVPSSGGYGPGGQMPFHTVPDPRSHSGPAGGGYRTPNPNAHSYGTPPAAALTNSPLTSETAAGVPTGKGKLVLVAIAAVMMAVGAAITILFVIKPSSIKPVNAVASSAAPAASETPAIASAAPVAKDTAPERADAGAAPGADVRLPTPEPAKSAATPSKTPAKTPTPVPVKVHPKPEEPTPTPTPTPTPKQPVDPKKKLDPGY